MGIWTSRANITMLIVRRDLFISSPGLRVLLNGVWALSLALKDSCSMEGKDSLVMA